MSDSKFKKFITSKGFKMVSASIILGCSIGGFYIAGFENARGLPATYKYYPSNKTLATVGNTTLKVDILKKQMNMFFATQPQKEFTTEEILEKEQMYIDYNITREALKQKALAENLTIADEIVNSQYDDLVTQLETMYSLTRDEIFKKFKLTESYIKESIKDELLGNAYLDKIGVTSDEEATQYFNDNPEEFIKCEASHILIKTIDDNYNTLSDEEIEKAKVKAQEVLEKALAGEDFAELAKEYSQDASAQDGGTLGFFGRGEMVEEFEEAVFNLNVGEITTELVQTQYGYHIIKKTGEQNATLEDSIASIKDSIAYEKKYNAMKEILDSPDVKIIYGE